MSQKTILRLSDLEKLSKEELLAVTKKVMEIKGSRRHRTLESFLETAHEGQQKFLHNKARIRYLFGGNRSGKSSVGIVEDLFWLLGRHPYRKVRLPVKGAVIVQDFENHARNILEPKMAEWAPAGSIVKIEKTQTGAPRKYFFSTGSTLDVLSHDQEAKTFEGNDLDFAHFDEPPPKHLFNAIWRGLTDRGGSAWVTATPLLSPWLYQEFKLAESGDPLRWCLFMDIYQNKRNLGEGDEALGMKRIEDFAALLDPEEKEARLRGQFVQMAGLIFKTWKRDQHLINEFPWPASWPIYESIDPHPRKAWAVSWTGVAENGAKILLRSARPEGVIDEVASEIIAHRTKLIQEVYKKPLLSMCLIDNYASAPLMSRSNTDPTARRKSIREELEDLIGPKSGGPPVIVAPKDVSQKIDIMKSWLHVKKRGILERADFFVFDNEENAAFVEEIEGYVWDRRRGAAGTYKNSPKKEGDDLLDTVMQLALVLKENSHEAKVHRGILGTYT